MTTAVKRACDACHRRKVKCDGINPCRNCSAAGLGCTYNAIPQKKGPKGSRAKVISELRETQRQTSLSAQVQNRINGIAAPTTNPSLAPTPGLVTSDMVKECSDFFFTNMYSQIPILSRQRLEQQAMYMDQSLDTYCLLASMCAFTIIQPGMGIPGGDPYELERMPGANIVSTTLLMEETIRVRKGYDYIESPSLNTLCTSYFLFACYYGLDMHEKAWFHLREAATMIHMSGMNREENYVQMDPVEASRRRRLYWLFFITERAYCLQRNRPLTLQATINLPSLGDDPTDPYGHQLNNFRLLITLFQPFDDVIASAWNKNRSSWSTTHIHNLQKQLSDILPSFLSYGDSQLADLRANQQWLKTMSWQINLANGNNFNGEESMVMYQQYAINLSESLVSGSSSGPQQHSEFLGKLLDIACALTDVLALWPASRSPFSPGPREQLNPLLNILSLLRNGDHRFVPLLMSKVHEVLPKLIDPMLQSVPDSVANNLCNVDIFDGFGNAGMGQPTPMMDDYEKKYVPTDSASSQGSGPSPNDLQSTFMSSPPGMSPGGGDYVHGLPSTPYNPISGVMMNQMQSPTVSHNAQAPTSSVPPTTLAQHPAHQSISALQNMAPHMQGGMSAPLEQPTPNLAMDHPTQNFGQPFNQGMPFALNMGHNMNTNNMMNGRQAPNRNNSFGVNQNAPMQNMGDINAMNQLMQAGTDMDFNTLR